MGYRGKLVEQERARRMRAQGQTLATIASTLSVAKSSVSVWVRDVEFTPSPRRTGGRRRPHRQHAEKLAQIDACDRDGVRRLGALGEQPFLAAGAALYAGEGGKRDGMVLFANTDERLIRFFCAWRRRFFTIDETRLRVRVYLHEGLDLDAAERHWSEVTGVPRKQFQKPYRAAADRTIRTAKHDYGCAYVTYCCARTHRGIMGLVRALLSCEGIPG